MEERRSRRQFLTLAGALAGASLLPRPRTALGTEGAGSPERPNFLIVVLDDMRADMLEHMPDTAAILSRGTVFRNAHAPTPQCSPARAALQTGRYAHNTGMTNNRRGGAPRFRAAGLARASYPYLLRRFGGYATAHFGKYLNFAHEVAPWRAPGHDRWLSTPPNANPVAADARGRVETLRWTGGPRDGRPVWKNAETEFLTERCADWMGRQRRPWCATLCPTAPHEPYTPEPEDEDYNAGVPMPRTASFDHGDPNKPDYVRRGSLTDAEKAEIRAAWRGQTRELRGVDRRLSALLAAVDFGTTYVFLLSDNGYVLGEHRRFHKQVPYTEATRVPLLIRGPGVATSGSDLLVSTLDVTATVAGLAGIEGAWPQKTPLDGRSLAPILHPSKAGSAGASGWRSFLLIQQAQETGHTGRTTAPGRRSRRRTPSTWRTQGPANGSSTTWTRKAPSTTPTSSAACKKSPTAVPKPRRFTRG